jgi:hypothetical protein
MPANRKPRRPYRPRASVYPDLHDVGLIFRPIHDMFDQLRTGEVDAVRGKPIFTDWQGGLCEIAPALDGWADCWARIAAGEGLTLPLDATRRLVKRLLFDVPMTPEDVQAAYAEIFACQRACMKITRAKMGDYMRVEQVAIELDRIGVPRAA